MKAQRRAGTVVPVVIFLLGGAGCVANGQSEDLASEGVSVAKADGTPVLGDGTHSAESVEITIVATSSDGLNAPRDLAFNPAVSDELWIVNQADDSMTVMSGVGSEGAQAETYAAPGNTHFLANPSGLAFGDNGMLATSHEEHERTQVSTPADFMGPTLWTSDRRIFDGGHGGHYDMLHNSPDSAGIAHWAGNAYFVFDGYHGSLTYYDFKEDHGAGGADHSDGVVFRFVEGELGYVPGVVSHLVVDRAASLVYVADTGNNRIAKLNPTMGSIGAAIHPNYDGTQQFQIQGADFETLVEGESVGLERPSGLELHEGMLFVGDNALSRVVALDLEGSVVDYLDLSDHIEPGNMQGLTLDESGALYVVDGGDNRVLRIAARAE